MDYRVIDYRIKYRKGYKQDFPVVGNPRIETYFLQSKNITRGVSDIFYPQMTTFWEEALFFSHNFFAIDTVIHWYEAKGTSQHKKAFIEMNKFA